MQQRRNSSAGNFINKLVLGYTCLKGPDCPHKVYDIFAMTIALGAIVKVPGL